MKRIIFFFATVLILFQIHIASAQVGIGTTTPSGALDVTSNSDGLLIPRVTLTANNVAAPVTTPTVSELVYNTATVGGANGVNPGYYYWDGSSWIAILTEKNGGWSLTGNTGTTAGTNFIGTTDAQDLRVKTGNTDRLNISGTNGNVGINTNNSTAKLEIDASTGTTPPLEIVPRTTAPTGTAGGQIAVIDNSLYIYDVTRTKWLSSETITFAWGHDGNLKGAYLDCASVQNQANTGFKMPYAGTIIAITALQSGGDASKGFVVRKNSASTDLFSFNLTALSYNNNTLNIDFDANDFLKVFTVAAGGESTNPVVTLFIKWRK
ncbi:MAG TPA: hypothetical protein VLB74_09445 [Flavobacterium sp.]|uniref:hypothetical protein n=1 Tax=Flavobacterium sp. TaxID=239 RepID=UPI002CAAFFEA|nr:hypothetical protein [Flavobacterium sp.]HSD14858.1 hypothetical protein [Flavobacterium sp.]